jgi:hypothetical protein
MLCRLCLTGVARRMEFLALIALRVGAQAREARKVFFL